MSGSSVLLIPYTQPHGTVLVVVVTSAFQPPLTSFMRAVYLYAKSAEHFPWLCFVFIRRQLSGHASTTGNCDSCEVSFSSLLLVIMAKDNLLVFGATGYIGKYIIERLVEGKESLGRISIFTSPQTAKTKPETLERLKRHGVKILIGDAMSDEDISNADKSTILHSPASALTQHSQFCRCQCGDQCCRSKHDRRTNQLGSPSGTGSFHQTLLPLGIWNGR